MRPVNSDSKRLWPTSRTGRSRVENVERLVTAEASTLAASSRRRPRIAVASSCMVPVAVPAGESTSTSQVPGVLPARISISRSLLIGGPPFRLVVVVAPGEDHREVGVGAGLGDEGAGLGVQV